MNSLKIGIVTIFDSMVNFGAFLQAYSLKLCLEDMGHTVFHVVKEPKDRFLGNYNRQYLAIKKSRKEPLWYFPIQCAKIIYRLTDNYVRYCVFNKDFALLDTISEYEASSMGLDLIICGSDEIWNINNINGQVGDSFYFAEGINNVKKTAFAPSVGNANIEQFKKAGYPLKELNKFGKILVRDTASQDLLQSLMGIKPNKVCDPTILVNTKCVQTKELKIRKPYLLVYSYCVDGKTAEYLKKFAKEENLLLIAAGMEHKFVDRNIIISPLAFGNLVKGAKFIYTSTLHGSIFTFLNKKRCVLSHPVPKVQEIIDTFGQTDRILSENSSYEEFCYIIKKQVNKEKIDNTINVLREDSFKELKGLLDEVL